MPPRYIRGGAFLPMNTDRTDHSAVVELRALRRELRDRRRAITGRARQAAARRMARHADAAGLLRRGARIGLYFPSAEEPDTAPLLALARARGCRIFLPRITSTQQARMRFHAADGLLRTGPWGMTEPVGGTPAGARSLHVVFLPLVGFDAAGHRIGMGKGFYDRHFAHRRLVLRLRWPLLIGVAYQVQQVPLLPHAPHFVALAAIVPESSSRWFRGPMS
jgi:5-formyltetrahydrofolate cyclo-ligase